ncbi:MAG TPA: ChaN family lipoprotein [Patescibacteria group bacterium]|nr:ChaN family lipoprotein [Patescibacteria group bacterium]
MRLRGIVRSTGARYAGVRFLGRLLACALALSWAAGAIAQDRASFQAIDLDSGPSLGQLVSELAAKRVVFIGEIHNRYDNHLNQLAIIRRLHALHPHMAIGVEYFQQPFQSHIDDYIAGKISEDEFLRTTQYFTRWGFDYRLYAPIFRYARAEHIPVRALNVPTKLVEEVARVGIAGVSGKDRAYLPRRIEPASPAYRKRLQEAFDEHQGMTFQHFVEAQLVWDEGMAKCAAAYLNAHKSVHMVILAGAGHMEFGSGIPHRLERRTQASYVIVLSSGVNLAPHVADYFLLSKKQNLPPAGVLDARLKEIDGECRIASLRAGGAGEKAGLRKADVLTEIDGHVVKGIADTRLALWNKKPGDIVRIEVRRKRFLRPAARLDFEVKLAASPQRLPENR